MKYSSGVVCPVCKNNQLAIKYEAGYIYTYAIDSNAPGLKNNEEFLPFLFDRRDQKEATQYIECNGCGSKYPCCFNHWDNGISITALQNAVSLENRLQQP